MHRKIQFVTVNQNSINYGGGKIVFHRSVVKACFVFCNPHCSILKTALHRSQLRIMSGPAGIRFQIVLSSCPAGRKFSCPVHLYSTRWEFHRNSNLQWYWARIIMVSFIRKSNESYKGVTLWSRFFSVQYLKNYHNQGCKTLYLNIIFQKIYICFLLTINILNILSNIE